MKSKIFFNNHAVITFENIVSPAAMLRIIFTILRPDLNMVLCSGDMVLCSGGMPPAEKREESQTEL